MKRARKVTCSPLTIGCIDLFWLHCLLFTWIIASTGEMNVLQFKDLKVTPDIVQEYSPKLRNSGTPLVIDNGSYTCRVGWAEDEYPRLAFRNLLAKPRRDRNKKDGDVPVIPVTQIGNDIVNIEALRFQLRTQFDRNVITHFHVQEQIFDHIFKLLGINTEGAVNHPIVMTEALLNPNYSRQLMSELLFECYNVPSVCYGLDSLFSYYRNMSGGMKDGLIVSCGFQATHVIPVLGGSILVDKSRRLNLGGSNMINFMHRLLQLKYPVHVNALTISRAEELLHQHARIAYDYQDLLRNWADLGYYEEHVRKFQLNFNQTVSSAPTLTAEQKMEKKRDLAKRLTEMNAKRRDQKLAEEEAQLNQLLNIRELYDDEEEDYSEEFEAALRENQIDSLEELEKMITTLSSKIEKTKQKMAMQLEAAANQLLAPTPVPAEVKIPQPPPGIGVDGWVQDVKQKRNHVIDRRTARKQRRQDLAKRHTAAAQERMRIISQLAKKDKGVDDFGMRDDDWEIYKTISKEGDNSDSDVENEKLLSYEMILRHHDPNFEEPLQQQLPESGIAEYHQIHVGVELFRVPELLFQPSMIGSVEAGLIETIDYILKLFSPEEQMILANNIFLTGSCCKFPGLKERLDRELTEIRPFQSTHSVTIAEDPSLDSWLGAKQFTQDTGDVRDISITREDYEEFGGDYLKTHRASNRFYETPSPILTGEAME